MTTAWQSNAFQNDAFQIDVVATVSGGKGDNRIFKPTGLVDRPKKTIHVPEGRKTVPERIEQTRQLVEEIKAEAELQPVFRMSLTKIDEEIGVRLRQKLKTEEEALLILLLAAAGS